MPCYATLCRCCRVYYAAVVVADDIDGASAADAIFRRYAQRSARATMPLCGAARLFTPAATPTAHATLLRFFAMLLPALIAYAMPCRCRVGFFTLPP